MPRSDPVLGPPSPGLPDVELRRTTSGCPSWDRDPDAIDVEPLESAHDEGGRAVEPGTRATLEDRGPVHALGGDGTAVQNDDLVADQLPPASPYVGVHLPPRDAPIGLPARDDATLTRGLGGKRTMTLVVQPMALHAVHGGS